jgi:carbonic anhydrase/acetyltransferase-like protein (isoleucine patch superfamily)
VAAGALVREDMVIPADALAVGVPATIRDGAGARQREWIRSAVATYLDLAERHRTGLRRLDV